MKLISIRILAVCLISLGLLSCKGHSDVRVLRLAHGLDVTHPVHRAMVYFGKRLKHYSSGKLTVKIYPSGQLGSERELIELVQLGSLDMTKVSASSLEPFVPKMKIFSVPYIFRNSKHLWDVLNGPIGKSLLNAGTHYRLKGLAYYDAGSRSFYTTHKVVKSPSDLKGLKIRVMNSPSAVEMVKTMGGSPTPISWGELYTSLQQGVVDGAENNLPSFYLSKHYEVAKHLVLDKHTAIPDVVITGTKTWNSFSPQEKKWVTKAMQDSVKYERKLWNKVTQSSLKAVKKAGVTVITPDKSQFVKSVSKIHREVEKSNLGDLFRKIEEVK